MEQTQLQKATANADKIAAAIVKKLEHKYRIFVRLHETPEYTFVEFGVQDVLSKAPGDTIAVAYSEQYMAAPNTPEELIAKARKILRDVRISLGMSPE